MHQIQERIELIKNLATPPGVPFRQLYSRTHHVLQPEAVRQLLLAAYSLHVSKARIDHHPTATPTEHHPPPLHAPKAVLRSKRLRS